MPQQHTTPRLLRLTCAQATRLISAALDGPLDRHARWALRLHLWRCRPCRQSRAQMRLIQDAARRRSKDQGRLSDDAKARIKEALQEHGGQASSDT